MLGARAGDTGGKGWLTFDGPAASAAFDSKGYRGICHEAWIKKQAIPFRMPSSPAASSAVCAVRSTGLMTGPGDNLACMHAAVEPCATLTDLLRAAADLHSISGRCT